MSDLEVRQLCYEVSALSFYVVVLGNHPVGLLAYKVGESALSTEWGFCLRDLFGLGLGTSDYGHLTVEHASMLLRNFRSLRDYSNQGFEASHKLQKQIYSRVTNHDSSGEASLCK